MAKDPHFLVQVMEKIGSPLIASVNDVAARLKAQNPDADANADPATAQAEDATKVATLLNKSVQVALSMSKMLDLSHDDREADSVRLSLTALAGPMLANQYRMSTRLPGENDIKRIVTSLEAVMTFSDNFTVAGDATVRLNQIDKDFFPADPTQIQIMYIQALVPTVNAVVAFPFGQPERKLVQDITGRLIAKAKEIVSINFPNLAEQQAKKSELAVLRSLATIYSQCHFGEMARLMALPADQRQQTSLDPVWASFDLRASLLEVLAAQAVPDSAQGQAGSSGGVAPAQNLQSEPPQNVAPQASAPPAQPPAQQAQQPAQPPPQTPAQPPPQTQQPPPAAEAPVQPPPEQPQAPVQPAAPPPVQTPPAQENVDNSSNDQNGNSENSNPMAFFKKPKASEESQSQS